MFGATDRLAYQVNLGAPVQPGRVDTLLFTEDSGGTDIRFDLTDEHGSLADLTGCGAQLICIRPDGATVTVAGTITGSAAAFTVPEAFLTVQGRGELFFRLTRGNVRKVVWCAECSIRLTSTDVIVDPTGVIPSLSELLAQIERMESLHDNNVKGYYATLAALQAAQPEPYPGDLYGVGSGGVFTYYIFDGTTSDWLDLGDIFRPEDLYVDWSGSVTIATGYGGTAKVVQHGKAVHVEYTSAASVSVTWDAQLLTLPADIRPAAQQNALMVYANRGVPNVGYGTVSVSTAGAVTINNLSAADSSQILLNFWYEL